MSDKQKPHIVVFNRSFWPDVEATGQLLTELCVGLSGTYKVTVIAGLSYYMREKDFKSLRFYRREKFGKVEILRVRHARFWKKSLFGRIINWLTYSLGAFFTGLITRPDMIIVCTDPPLIGIVAMVIGRLKGVPLIYNCRDLYPDVAWGLGRLKKTHFLSLSFDYLNSMALRSAKIIICLGESMKKRIIRKGIAKELLAVVPDWVDSSWIKPIDKVDNHLFQIFGQKEKFIIMHSGNIGLSQNFNLILKAVKKVKDKEAFCMLFVGEGAAKEQLQQEVRRLDIKNILFFPYQPKEELPFSLSLPDLHIVSLKKGMSGAVVPSKIYAILAAGKAYLAIAEEDCEAVTLAKEYGCGLTASPDDIDGIVRSLEWAITHRDQLQEMGRRGRALAQTKFDKNIVMDEWLKLLEGLNR